MPQILIIGATGTVGRHVAAQMPAGTRALVRNPQTTNLPSQVELIQGDLTRTETLDPALAGIDTVFLVWTAPPAAAAPALDRILTHARRVVFLTAPWKNPHPLFQGSQPNPMTAMHADIEQRIETSGRDYTFIRPGMFAANALNWWAPQIRSGVDIIRWPHSTAPTAPIHERDIAAVAVRALLDIEHAGGDYTITGPESLTQSQQLEVIGRAIGRPLRMEEISPEAAHQELLPVIPAPGIRMLLRAWCAAIGQPALVTSTFQDVTGTPPRTFRGWASDHASEFRA